MISPVDPYLEGFRRRRRRRHHRPSRSRTACPSHAAAHPHAGQEAGHRAQSGTPVDAVDDVLDLVDLVLIMTRQSGLRRTDLHRSQLKKIEAAPTASPSPAATSRSKSTAASRRKPRGRRSPPAPTCWSPVPQCSRAGRRTTPPTSPPCAADAVAERPTPRRLPPIRLLPEMVRAAVWRALRGFRVWYRRTWLYRRFLTGPLSDRILFHPHDALPRKLEDADCAFARAVQISSARPKM